MWLLLNFSYCLFLELLKASCKWLWNSVPDLLLLEVYSGDQLIESFKRLKTFNFSITTKINNTGWRCDEGKFVEHVEITFENKIT